jgi:hypothetical protein
VTVATTAYTTADKHIIGYDQYIRENWGKIEQWERDLYESANDRSGGNGKTNRALKTPGLAPGMVSRTVSMGYMLIAAGLFISPLYVLAAALAFGAINLGRGKTSHGLIQIALAGVALALFSTGHGLSWESLLAFQDRVAGR